MEFAHILNSFGVEVCVVEMMDSILPLEDKEAARVYTGLFKSGVLNSIHLLRLFLWKKRIVEESW